MKFKFEMVPAERIFDLHSKVRLIDVAKTIQTNLTEDELKTYDSAIFKVSVGEKMSRSDAIIFNKIDAITMQEHGMCLKDSKVTKARLKACRRYGIKFIDRDGLIDHMKLMLG